MHTGEHSTSNLDPSLEFSWRRPMNTEDEWTEIADEIGARDPRGGFVVLAKDETDLLSILLAPSWVSARMPSDREGWHSHDDAPPASFLESVFRNATTKPDPETITTRVRSISTWTKTHAMFGPFTDVSETIEYLTNSGQPQVGHYLVELEGGECYIGETTDFRTRLRTHRRNFGPRVCGFYIRPDLLASTSMTPKMRKAQLLKAERILIHDAQRSGLYAHNFKEMSHPIKESATFAEAIAPLTADEWVKNPPSQIEPTSMDYKQRQDILENRPASSSSHECQDTPM